MSGKLEGLMLVYIMLSSLMSENFEKFKRYIYKQELLLVYMGKEFNIIIEQGEDGYLISEVVELPGCRTQAKSYDELIKRTREAISLYLKCQKEPVKLFEKFVGVQRIAV